MVWVLLWGGGKLDCPASSRSTQAWKGVLRPASSFRRRVQRPVGAPVLRKTPIMLSPLLGSCSRLATKSTTSPSRETVPLSLGSTLPKLVPSGCRISTLRRPSPGYHSSSSFWVMSPSPTIQGRS